MVTLPLVRFLVMLAVGAVSLTVYVAAEPRRPSPPPLPASPSISSSASPIAPGSPGPSAAPTPGASEPLPLPTPSIPELPLPTPSLPLPSLPPIVVPTPQPTPCIAVPGVRICLVLPTPSAPALVSAYDGVLHCRAMSLLPPIDNATLTQGFGPSPLGVEPAMYADGKRAWWQPFVGAKYYPHFHAALDLAAPGGTVIRASESGTVIESYFDRTNGGGNKVRVQIRPGVSYCHNHMATRSVALGAFVTRGQKLGTVGTTGWSTGNHDHFWVGFDDEIGSQTWPTLLNPQLFLPGGALQNDPRIEPLRRFVVVNGPGVNIRTSPDLDQAANIFATVADDGIYRNGKRVAAKTYRFTYGKTITTDDGAFVRVTGLRHTLFIAKQLVHFV